MRVMGDQPFFKKMGPYKRLEYDSAGIRYGISVRVSLILTPKSVGKCQTAPHHIQNHTTNIKQ